MTSNITHCVSYIKYNAPTNDAIASQPSPITKFLRDFPKQIAILCAGFTLETARVRGESVYSYRDLPQARRIRRTICRSKRPFLYWALLPLLQLAQSVNQHQLRLLFSQSQSTASTNTNFIRLLAGTSAAAIRETGSRFVYSTLNRLAFPNVKGYPVLGKGKLLESKICKYPHIKPLVPSASWPYPPAPQKHLNQSHQIRSTTNTATSRMASVVRQGGHTAPMTPFRVYQFANHNADQGNNQPNRPTGPTVGANGSHVEMMTNAPLRMETLNAGACSHKSHPSELSFRGPHKKNKVSVPDSRGSKC